VETATQALPDMLTGKTVTLGAGGVIAAAEIEDASFWSVWESDPRATIWGEGRNALQIHATGLGNGDVKVDRAAGVEVYVIYKTLVPQWTVDKQLTCGSFAVGDLIYCNGKVYRSLADDANAGDLSDANVWAEVTLPQSLQRIVVLKANFDRLWQGTNTPAVAEPAQAELLRALDAAFAGAQALVGTKLWLYNQNQA